MDKWKYNCFTSMNVRCFKVCLQTIWFVFLVGHTHTHTQKQNLSHLSRIKETKRFLFFFTRFFGVVFVLSKCQTKKNGQSIADIYTCAQIVAGNLTNSSFILILLIVQSTHAPKPKSEKLNLSLINFNAKETIPRKKVIASTSWIRETKEEKEFYG